MGLLSKLASVAAPVAGFALGGPAGAAAGSALAGAVFGGKEDKPAQSIMSSPEAQARIKLLMERLAEYGDSPYQGAPMRGITRGDLDPIFGSTARASYIQQQMNELASQAAPPTAKEELQQTVSNMRGNNPTPVGRRQFTLYDIAGGR